MLIVDEPTAGLDPEERVRFRNLLSDLSGDRIVILSTHIVSDVEATATDIALISTGTLVAHAPPEDLLRARGRPRLGVGHSQRGSERRQAALPISGTVRRADGVHVRLLAESEPPPARVPVAATLEDAYLHCSRHLRAPRSRCRMMRGHVLWHLARPTFLERVRRTSFLVTLAFAAVLGYQTYRGSSSYCSSMIIAASTTPRGSARSCDVVSTRISSPWPASTS